MRVQSALMLLALLFARADLAAQSADFFPLSDVKPGLSGTGRTIFEGVEIEDFKVEILGVVRNISPQQNMILARLSGEQIEKTGVFAGISGSPVYIDGKLLGAVAYSFPFSKEPIAGITPISEMVDIFKERPASGQPASSGWKRPVSDLVKMASGELPFFPGTSHSISTAELGLAGNLAPISTPINLGGLSARTVAQFSNQFQALGLTPVRGLATTASTDYPDVPLAPGSTLTVQMVRGDMNASAAGTVTHISGDRVYAFGHPFMGTGFTDMPIAKGAVLTVVSSVQSSHKVTATLDAIGSLRQDRATGIMGIMRATPKLLPVKINLLTSRNEKREYNFEIITDPFLTPLLMTLAVFNSLSSSERTMGGQSLQLKSTIAIKGQQEVLFETSISDLINGPVMAAVSASSPVGFLLTSGFDDLEMEKIDLEIRTVEEQQTARLDRVWVDRGSVRPGQEFKIGVALRKPNGDTLQEEYTMRMPREIPPGPVRLLVGEGQSIVRVDNQFDRGEFIPETLPQLIRAINNLKRNNRLYVRLYRNNTNGFAVRSQGLPGLPPSLLEIYGSKRQSGDARKMNRVVFLERELPATRFALQGHEILELNVEG